MTTDILPFVRAWVSHPLRVASIIPSGEALAALITKDIDADTGPVLELGPGTGVFTRALLARGVPESALTLVEFGGEFSRMLERRFPAAQVLHMDAARLGRCDALASRQMGAVVSGLPLLSMSPRKVMAILGGVFAHLAPGGALYQFTYGPRCPVSRRMLDRLSLRAVRVGTVLRNMPPATVYRISRRGPARGHPQPTPVAPACGEAEVH
ncbi:methyltransferase domain-containing protein [Verticiella sediminum]|uniref:Methyltransferase domain-containing protein n=1 Tax=Verticiella sediminum TaxID=1247510 RepID=A0A556AYK3_9BURK|nr:methyltransferase domain-containing protein [Verticiella sediminum]TSH98020.1 methyltransferase domain-containing protein [Verticiella sediminum]